MGGTESKEYYRLLAPKVLQEMKSSVKGLSEGEAKARIEKYGPNELTAVAGKGKLAIFLEQFSSFIVYILIAATIISALLGEYVDAVVIGIILVLNAVMGFIQEYKAEKSIDALKRLASPQCVVIRDGKEKKVFSNTIVPGDILFLEPGEKIPADARILTEMNLTIEEASLTGESVPVHKHKDAISKSATLGDRKNMLYSSTIVTEGHGTAVVVGTGMNTQIGKIAHMIQSAPVEETPLQKRLKRLGTKLGMITIVVCVIVFFTGILRGGSVLEMFLAAVSLAVAAIPEGLPAVVTISLALGVQKMVKRNALIRKLPSVETLGSTTVICTDKTGTLTQNEMTVTKLYVDHETVEVSGTGYSPEGKIGRKVDSLLFRIGVLCNDASLDKDEKDWKITGDPTEGCLLTVAEKAGVDHNGLQKRLPRIDEKGFDSTRKMMTTIHKEGKKVFAYTKGAPDQIVKGCSKILVKGKVRKITAKDKEDILGANDGYASHALRVLGFAYQPLSSKYSKKGLEKDMIFVGLQGMIDPPREEVKIAIEKCRSAGIKVVMITGDYKQTAVAVGEKIGLVGKAVEGEEIDKIDLDKHVEDIAIYARVDPEHKLKIVKALKKKGHIVAMTGDGINDAPALKQADIGVSMGITGTDVAKDASDMVLTDDNFTSIVNAVEEGRNIYDNIKKFVNYLLSSNMGEVLVLFVAMLIGFSDSAGAIVLPLVAIQILWMNLITDGLPALALGVDPVDPRSMEKPPRPPGSTIISRNMAWSIVVIGILVCVGTLYVFKRGLPDVTHARSMALTTIIVLEIVRLEMIRSQYHTKTLSNGWLNLAVLTVLGLQMIVLYTPLNHIFKVVPLSLGDWGLILSVSFVTYIIGVVASRIIRKVTHQTD